MADKTVQAKVLQVALTTEQWADETTAAKVISKGQIVVEYCTDGSTRTKVGDGVNVFANLPYVNTELDTVLNSTTKPAQGKATGDAIANVAANLNSLANVVDNLPNSANITITGDNITGSANIVLGQTTNIPLTITSIDVESTTFSGSNGATLPLSIIPQGALERLVIVADNTALLALTTDDVQNGDVVKVTSSGLMYFVKDEDELGTMDAFEEFTAGTASAVEWSNVNNAPHILANANVATDLANAPTGDLADANATYTLVNGINGTLSNDITDINTAIGNINNATIEVNIIGAVTATAANTTLGGNITLETTVNNISKSDVGLGNVDDVKQIYAQEDANVVAANVVVWGNNGHTVEDAGFAASSVVLDTDTLILNCTL